MIQLVERLNQRHRPLQHIQGMRYPRPVFNNQPDLALYLLGFKMSVHVLDYACTEHLKSCEKALQSPELCRRRGSILAMKSATVRSIDIRIGKSVSKVNVSKPDLASRR